MLELWARWGRSLSVYADRRMLLLWCLGFASGLPRLLVYSTLSFWLLDKGSSIKLVGFFALVSIPYTIKFLWAPILDRLKLPVLNAALGQRRAWMLVTQLGVIAGLLLMASADPEAAPWLMALFALMVSFFSASQDVVVDAYRVEILSDEEQGAGVAVAVFGYRVAMLVAGAGALLMATWLGSWPVVYGSMAALMLFGVASTLLGGRPLGESAREQQRALMGFGAQLKDAIVGPLRDFTRRQGWLMILSFIMLFKLGDSLASTMLNPFLIDLGFDKIQIASIAKTYGFAASMLGIFLGGWFVRSLSMVRVLWLAAFMQMFSNLVFLLQAHAGAHILALIATISVENVCGGIGTAAFVAYLSKLCHRNYTATQYALLTALSSLINTLLSSLTGIAAEALGWSGYFLMTMAAAAPGLVVLYFLIQRVGLGEDGSVDPQRRVEEALS